MTLKKHNHFLHGLKLVVPSRLDEQSLPRPSVPWEHLVQELSPGLQLFVTTRRFHINLENEKCS